MSSLCQDSSSWISEWETQVAKHNHNSNPEKQCPVGFPLLPLGKHQDGRRLFFFVMDDLKNLMDLKPS
jgi:hypothetical protein